MIKLILGIPLLGFICNNIIISKYNKSRIIYMIFSILTLYIILFFILSFNNNNNEFQYREGLFYFFSNAPQFTVGLDGINITLITLMCIIEPILILLSKEEIKDYNPKELKRFINYLILIKIFILIFFLTFDLLIFFFTFEAILIPMFLLISRYGSKYLFFLPRLEASLRFFMFTMIGSLLMLIAILIFFIKYGTTNNELLNIKIFNDMYPLSNSINLLKILWIFLFFSFLIKIPMFPFHTWLPLAHSDAPTSGSVILAAILLKLASFGILRYSLYIFQPLSLSFNTLEYSSHNLIYSFFLPIIYILSILSILYCALTPLRALFDLKKIIAYSSIVHMNFSIFGFFSSDFSGLTGASFLMFTHAFISSSLFLLVGFLYKRYHSRFLPYFQGITTIMPLFSFFFLFFSFANISLPFCSSFLSEFFIFTSSFHANPFLSFILLFSLLFSSSFIIWFTNRLLFGSLSPFIFLKITSSPLVKNRISEVCGSLDLSISEFFSLFPLFFFTVFFSFFPQPLLSFFSLPLILLGI